MPVGLSAKTAPILQTEIVRNIFPSPQSVKIVLVDNAANLSSLSPPDPWRHAPQFEEIITNRP